MQFSLVFLSALVGMAAAGTSTVYSTETLTTTTCGPSVTNCPVGKSSSTSSAAAVTSAPVNTTSIVVPPVVNATSSSSVGGASISLLTITTEVCIPTSYVSTITLSSTSTPAVTTGAASGTGVGSTSSAAISPSITPYTGAASNVHGSMAIAGLAAVAALVMA